MTTESTVLLYTYSNQLEAGKIQDKLKAAGIDSFIENPEPAGDETGGDIKVKIFSKDLEAAEKIINE